METRANYVLVGIFTLVAILAGFGFVYWTARVGESSQSVLLRVRIPGSAAGLGRGSAVLFNGVKVGDVRRVYIDVSNPDVAIADTHVDPLTPITRSTRASIGIVGLTGTANIEIIGGNPNEESIFRLAEQNDTIPEIVAEPSVVTNILESATTFLQRADIILEELQGFVQDARQPLAQTMRNVEQFTTALAGNADQIDNFLRSAGRLAETLDGVSGQLGATLDAARKLIEAVDGERVDEIIASVERFTEKVDRSADHLGEIMGNIEEVSKNLADLSGRAGSTVERVDDILAGIDPELVRTTLANIGEASETARAVAADVGRVTSKFGARADEIDTIISNVNEMSDRLNKASARIDQVLASLDGFLGSPDSQGLMSEARSTLESFRKVAETLNARVGTITDGLARFTGPGLRDIEALVRDARRSISRIEQAVTDFERNPQRILSGGEGDVRRYDGRARR
jgi:phospholipid/cholesterol/gamma-HCH transport system substrate-binding protein